ncbi:hypothetical protein FDG2_3189 [Candidatus Protofrankia californiensis]|uniref:Uncharacterized protein n=1 Tax=Candidatus Protofrankia californiensis TaxID=1839754 RepID=A0A1C3NZ34_9ACTN|nr:hypothetical protein FDG2_3189 [Candidatus Protofrankia californiensis]
MTVRNLHEPRPEISPRQVLLADGTHGTGGHVPASRGADAGGRGPMAGHAGLRPLADFVTRTAMR